MSLQHLFNVQKGSICLLSGLNPRCIWRHNKLCEHDICLVCENAQMEKTNEKIQPLKCSHSSEYREDILLSTWEMPRQYDRRITSNDPPDKWCCSRFNLTSTLAVWCDLGDACTLIFHHIHTQPLSIQMHALFFYSLMLSNTWSPCFFPSSLMYTQLEVHAHISTHIHTQAVINAMELSTNQQR